MQDFTLWLEFEHADYSSRWDAESEAFITDVKWDNTNEACNIIVDLPDGRHYGITVWTYAFLTTVVALSTENQEHLTGLYQIPPDLFVKELTRASIEATITDLLRQGNLEEVLNPTVLGKPSSD